MKVGPFPWCALKQAFVSLGVLSCLVFSICFLVRVGAKGVLTTMSCLSLSAISSCCCSELLSWVHKIEGFWGSWGESHLSAAPLLTAHARKTHTHSIKNMNSHAYTHTHHSSSGTIHKLKHHTQKTWGGRLFTHTKQLLSLSFGVEVSNAQKVGKEMPESNNVVKGNVRFVHRKHISADRFLDSQSTSARR